MSCLQVKHYKSSQLRVANTHTTECVKAYVCCVFWSWSLYLQNFLRSYKVINKGNEEWRQYWPRCKTKNRNIIQERSFTVFHMGAHTHTHTHACLHMQQCTSTSTLSDTHILKMLTSLSPHAPAGHAVQDRLHTVYMLAFSVKNSMNIELTDI